MRIILKIIAAPFMLALTLIVAVLSFSVSVASWVTGILSLVFAVGGLFELFIQSHTSWGITWLVMAFLLSPFGLPAVAEWLICKLAQLLLEVLYHGLITLGHFVPKQRSGGCE